MRSYNNKEEDARAEHEVKKGKMRPQNKEKGGCEGI